MALIKTDKQFLVWRGTLAQYQAITTKSNDTLYYVTSAENELAGRCFLGSKQMGMQFKSVATFPTEGQEQGILYLGPNAEAKYWNGTAWVVVCYPLTTTVSSGSTDAEVASAKAIYTFVNTMVSGLGRLRPAVDNIAGLKAISDAQDKDLCLVEGKGSLYRYDAQSTDTADDDKVILPNNKTAEEAGRWIKMTTTLDLTAGNGITISGTEISVNASSTYFEFDGTTKELKFKQSLLDAKMDKLTGSFTASDVLTVDSNGQATDSGKQIGGDEFASTEELRKTKLATEHAVKTQLDTKQDKDTDAVVNNAAKFDSNGNTVDAGKAFGADADVITSASAENTLATEKAVAAAVTVEQTRAEGVEALKLDEISGTNDDILTVASNGAAVADSGKKLGGDTISSDAATQKVTMATEFVVATARDYAIENAKVYWYETQAE